MITVLLAALGVVGAVSLNNKADAKVMRYTEGDLEWNYTIDDSVVNSSATDVYLGNISTISSDITIPASFTDEYGTHAVNTIGRSTISGADSFFDGCEFSSKVIIDIDASACTGLERINSYAFYGKTRINEIRLPKTVSSIGSDVCASCADTTIYTENPNIIFEGTYDGWVKYNAPSRSTALDFVGTSRYTSNGTVTYRVDFDKAENGAQLSDAPLKTYAYIGPDRDLAALTAVSELSWYDFAGYYTEKGGKGTRYYDSKGKLLQDITADMTLYAHYIPNDFTITYHNVESWEVLDAPKKYTYHSGIACLYQPERTGYTFQGWYDNEAFEGNPVTKIDNTEHGDKVLFAKWEVNRYRIQYSCPDGVTGYMEEQIVKYGENATLNPVKYTKAGYIFYQWNTKEDGSGISYKDQQEVMNLSTEMDSVITLYPIFHASNDMPVEIIITYKALPGQEDEVVTDTRYGTTGEQMLIDPAAYAKPGFQIPGKQLLTVKGEEKYNTTELVFEREEYQVTLEPGKGVKEVEGLGTYQYGQTAVLKAVPEEGYTVTGYKVVRGSGKGTQVIDGKLTIEILEETEIAVEVKGISYRISYELNGGSFRSEDYIEEYTHGEKTMLPTNVSKVGFRFIGWYDEAGNKVEKIGVEETGSKIYYAKYGEGIYHIQYHTDGGTLSGNYAQSYKWNVGAALPTESNIKKEGYSFLGWWDGKSIVNKILKTDSEDKDLYALWQSNSTTVMSVVNGLAVEEIQAESKTVALAAVTSKNTGYYYKQLNNIEKRLYHTLYNVYRFVPSQKKILYDGCIDVTATEKISTANGYSASVALVFDHPEIYWLRGFGIFSFENGKKLRFSPYDAYRTYLADAEMYEGYFKNALKAIGIHSKDSVYTKIKKINEYIVKEYSYNISGYTLNESTSNDTRSVGRMLASKIGCCEGYARLAKVFCDYYGIECVLVKSKTHMWNNVKVGGKWYTLDVTWNENKKDGKGTISTNDYFLKGLISTLINDSGNEHTTVKYNYVDINGKPITEYGCFNAPTLSYTDYKVPTTLPSKNTRKVIGAIKYKVTKSVAKNGTVSVVGVKNKKIAKATIPATIKINGYSFLVTEVGSKAFYNCKKIKSVTVGKNVKKIGSKAFYKAKKLKKVTIKSKKLKTVGKNAWKGINKKAVIKVPKSKKKAYRKLLNKKSGFTKNMKFRN